MTKVSQIQSKNPLSPRLSKILLEALDNAMCQEKEIEGIQIGKEDIKWSLFADDMIIYIEKKNTPPQIPGTNKYSSNISGYKVNIKKSK